MAIVFKKPKRKVKRVFIHCSASDVAAHDDVSIIEEWHNKRGFSGVGYHYFIKSNGQIQIGRDLEKEPAAQRGNNKGTIAICLHGKKNFTEYQFEALAVLCSQIDNAYRHKVTFHGHCEVSSKSCPVFDYRAVLDLTRKGYMRRAFPVADIKGTERPLNKSRTMQGAGSATIGTVGAAISEPVSEAAEKIEPLAPYSEALQWLFVALALIGVGLTIYARIDDRNKGYR